MDLDQMDDTFEPKQLPEGVKILLVLAGFAGIVIVGSMVFPDIPIPGRITNSDIIPSEYINADDDISQWTRKFGGATPPFPQIDRKPMTIEEAVEIENSRFVKDCDDITWHINLHIKENLENGKARFELYGKYLERTHAMETVLAEFRKQGWKIKYEVDKKTHRYTTDYYLVFTR